MPAAMRWSCPLADGMMMVVEAYMGLPECAHGHEGQHSQGERTSMLCVGSAVSRLAVMSVKLHHSSPL